MKKIEYLKGDLFSHKLADEHMVVQVCNDKGVAGSGVVLAFKKHYPKSIEAYEKAYKDGSFFNYYGGPFTFKQGKTLFHKEDGPVIGNMIAQDLYVRSRPLNYASLVHCMEQVVNACKYYGIKHIVAPKFGSERAGGNWDFIVNLIEDIWLENDLKVTVYEYN